MIMRFALGVLCLCFALGAAGQPAPAQIAARRPAPILLGDRPLLFADDAGVSQRSSLVREFHAGKTRTQPVLVADQPWEYQRVYMWGSVYRDRASGKLQMWYMSRLPPPGMQTRMLYATSTDGVHWTKPALGLQEFNGSTRNNIIAAEAGSAAVLVDPRPDETARRYKMVMARHGGYDASYSPDGTHWTAYAGNPVLKGDDTATIAQDPATGEFLLFHKQPTVVRGFKIRAVWLARSRDFQTWSQPAMVFSCDAADDDWISAPGERTEVYDMPVFAHAAGFIGLPAIFRNTPQELTAAEKAAGAVMADGPIDIQIATSSDGVTWRRSWPRIAIIPRGGPGSFDAGAILNTACASVDTEDETWVYYTAITTTHGKTVPPKSISIGRAEWRLHGFASLDAGPTVGAVTTQTLQLTGSALLVNADASHGELRAALLDADGKPIPGFGFDECEVLKANATKWSAHWAGQSALPTDRPVQVSLALKNARLFSLSSQTNR